MQRIPKGSYTREFREEAVKLVKEGKFSLPEAARRLSLPTSTIANWVRADAAGKLSNIGKSQHPLTETEAELSRVKRELAEMRMERDLLKKAAAYFAKESLPGTR